MALDSCRKQLGSLVTALFSSSNQKIPRSSLAYLEGRGGLVCVCVCLVFPTGLSFSTITHEWPAVAEVKSRGLHLFAKLLTVASACVSPSLRGARSADKSPVTGLWTRLRSFSELHLTGAVPTDQEWPDLFLGSWGETENPAKMPLAQIAEPWPTMELVQLETEVKRGDSVHMVCFVFMHLVSDENSGGDGEHPHAPGCSAVTTF